MSDYPRLTEMGVASFDQIAGYTVNSLDLKDFLRIDFDRPEGSILPCTRTYDFPRVQKTAAGSGSGKATVVMETNPALRDALAELKQIVGARDKKKGSAACILEELQRLEDETAAHAARIRDLIEKLA